MNDVHTNQAYNSYGNTSLWSYDVGAGVYFDFNIPVFEKASLMPIIYLGYSYALFNPTPKLNVTPYAGGSLYTVDSYTYGRDSFVLDAQLLYVNYNSLEIGASYNIELKEKYRSQGGSINISYKF